jgi:hypothetical protein
MMALAIHWRLRPDNPVKGIERNVGTWCARSVSQASATRHAAIGTNA